MVKPRKDRQPPRADAKNSASEELGVWAVLGVFGTLFIVGAVFGAVFGQRQEAEAKFFENLTVARSADRYFLEHSCKKNVTHRFDVEANILVENPTNMLSPPWFTLARLRLHKDVLLSLAGGSSGAITFSRLKTMAKNRNAPTTAQQARRVAVVLVAAVSGYSFGYWITSGVDCDAEAVKALLRDKNYWIQMKRTFLLYELYELVGESRWQEHFIEKSGEHYSSFEQIVLRCRLPFLDGISTFFERIQSDARDPGYQDFALVAMYHKVISAVRGNPAYQEYLKCMNAQSSDDLERDIKDPCESPRNSVDGLRFEGDRENRLNRFGHNDLCSQLRAAEVSGANEPSLFDAIEEK